MKLVKRSLSLFIAMLTLLYSLPFGAFAYVDGSTIDQTACNGEYQWPVPESGTISQGYEGEIHDALDIAAPEGTTVVAAHDGQISSIQNWDGVSVDGNQSYGNKIEITQENGTVTYYAHLSSILVTQGDTVSAGDSIGAVGATGNVTGSHLHFEVLTPNGNADPMEYFFSSETPGDTESEDEPEMETEENTEDSMVSQEPDKTSESEATPSPDATAEPERTPESEETPVSEEAPLPEGINDDSYYVRGSSLSRAAQRKGTLISTGDINVLTGAPYTNTFADIGTLLNKMMEYPDGSRDTAYCIEHGVDVNYPEDYDNVGDLITDPLQRDLVGDALSFGFKADDGRIDSERENSEYAATQLLIWEILAGKFHTSQAKADVLNVLDYSANPSVAKSFYLNLVETIQNKYEIPSFASSYSDETEVIELKWDGSKYSTTVSDSKGALSKFNWQHSGLGISKSGNKLTVTSSAAVASKITMKATYEAQGGSEAVVTWQNKDPSRQNVATAWNATDPINAYISVKTEDLGTLKIVKTSEDGKVNGIKFTIKGNGIDITVTTGKNGEIEIPNLVPGTYTVTEESISHYEPQKSQKVTVEKNKTATVTFRNILRKGDLKIIKTSEDGIVDNITFTIEGNGISETVKSDKNGVITVPNLVPGEYTVTEKTDDRYNEQKPKKITVVMDQTTTVEFANKLKRGDIKLIKTSEDGVIEGITFTVTGGDINQTVTTDKDGVISIKGLLPGEYTITEEPIDRYEPQQEQRITVEGNKVTAVQFHNVLKRGNLKVTKTSEDKLVEGMKFKLTGTSLSGIPVDEYATSNAEGVAVFKNILISGVSPYTLEEVGTPDRYVIPEAQEAVIEWNKVTGQSFHNTLKKFRVTVKKEDNETGEAQGDGTLMNAIYGIYKGETLVDSYATDENGQFVTKYYVCADDWTTREIEASPGYLVDPTVYKVGSKPELYQVELSSTAVKASEQVIKGDIAIIKHTDDGGTQVEIPEEGAEFQIYLKSAGSFEDAKDSEKDHLVCDKNGYAQTKKLPYGQYTVHQTKSWDGRELMKDFDVYIAKDSETYRYIINNACFTSFIKVVKVDEETEKNIAYAGAGFQIYKPDGTLVTMKYTYPKPVTVDTFYTNDEGYLVTPEKLPYGKGYALVEVQAPIGYVLDPTPVSFDVIQENTSEEEGVTVIKLTKPNKAQRGVIKINKSGEMFTGVTESDGLYQPVFSEQGLEGAAFEVRAAEDIKTLDGTVRYNKGELVDLISSDNKGIAQSRPLYLGKYEVKEKSAPSGMVISDKVHQVELIYAGQEVEITLTELEVYNDRQKVSVSINKIMEQDEKFGLGGNSEISRVVFGLYAAEEIKAADGTAIPADGLIERIAVAENGLAISKVDLPFGKYYLQEIATDEHYILGEDKYPFEFQYGGQDISLIEIKANNGEAVKNSLKRGEVKGRKLDENGSGLAGAVIGLFPLDCKEFTEGNALLTTESGEEGSFGFALVPYGEYIVREIAPPEGFILTEENFPVKIDENGQVIEIAISNKQIRGNLRLTKYDADYPENKLSGAVFEVFRDTDGNKKLDDADLLIGTMDETEKGLYEMKGVAYGGVLVREKTAPEGFELDENAYYVFIDTDGKIYDVENEAGKGFLNRAQKGSLKIIKTSSDGRKAGFEFRVTGQDYDKTFITNESGEIFIENLRIGKYVVTELKNSISENYILADPVTVEVIHNETLVVSIHNNKPQIEVPKTGDNSNMTLWLSLMVVGAAGAVAIIIISAKGKKGKRRTTEK